MASMGMCSSIQDFEHADVRRAAGAAAGQHQPDARTMRRGRGDGLCEPAGDWRRGSVEPSGAGNRIGGNGGDRERQQRQPAGRQGRAAREFRASRPVDCGSPAKNTSTGGKNDWTITGLRCAGGDRRQPPVSLWPLLFTKNRMSYWLYLSPADHSRRAARHPCLQDWPEYAVDLPDHLPAGGRWHRLRDRRTASGIVAQPDPAGDAAQRETWPWIRKGSCGGCRMRPQVTQNVASSQRYAEELLRHDRFQEAVAGLPQDPHRTVCPRSGPDAGAGAGAVRWWRCVRGARDAG